MTAPGHTAELSVSPHSSARNAAQPRAHQIFAGRTVLRRVVFVGGYETLSVVFTVFVLGALLGHGGVESTLTAILVSTTATVWNYLWNTGFEAIERRVGATRRGVVSRAVHALGYEGGVLVFTIPLVALMLGIGLVEALMIEGGLLVFFLVFTVAYTWLFDRVFGLPQTATPTH